MLTSDITQKLNSYHQSVNGKVKILDYTSPVAGSAFPGDFNVSGYHNEITDLPNNPHSFWGIDKCIRAQENVDDVHSFLFHMGIFATSMQLEGKYANPFLDKRYINLQKIILSQCLELLGFLGFSSNKLEATFLGEVAFGGTGTKGRDRLLKNRYKFPRDKISELILRKQKIRAVPVSSLANIDIHPIDGAFVGPRIEIANSGIEIATVVFNCFRIGNRKLQPMNYIAGYALGIERIVMALAGKTSIIDVVERYRSGIEVLKNINPSVASPLLRKEMLEILFGIEALVAIGENYKLSSSRRDIMRKLRQKVRHACNEVGIQYGKLETLQKHYKKIRNQG